MPSVLALDRLVEPADEIESPNGRGQVEWRVALHRESQSCALGTCAHDHLATAFRVLVSTRNGALWGPFRGAGPTLYHSSVACTVLAKYNYRRFATEIEACVEHYQLEYRGNPHLDRLSLEDLRALMRTLAATERSDSALIDRATAALVDVCRNSERVTGAGFVDQVARSALAIAGYAGPDKVPQDFWERLLSEQNDEDGSWSRGTREEATIALTARAVLALSRAEIETAAQGATRGREFLLAVLERTSWEAVAPSADAHLRTMLLRALVTSENSDERLVSLGVRWLLDATNEEGCWGTTRGGPTAVEQTALSLRALLEARAHDTVSSRVAEFWLARLSRVVDGNAERLNELEERFEEAIVYRYSALKDENARLRNEGERLDVELSEAKHRTETVERENATLQSALVAQLSYDDAVLESLRSRMARLSSRQRLLHICAELGLAVFAALALILDMSSTIGVLATAVLGLAFAIGICGILYRIERSYRVRAVDAVGEDRGAGYARIAGVHDRFVTLTKSWGRDEIGQLVFALYVDISDLPLDILERRAEELVVGHDGEARLGEWRQWIRDLGRMEPEERRVVLRELHSL